MKAAICLIIKQENLYLRDYILYHLDKGFTNFILYDNNDIEGEDPHEVISDYILNGTVIYKDVRSQRRDKFHLAIQMECYNKCYDEYKSQFDWIFFIDIDEFVLLKHFNNVNEYLSSGMFDNANMIHLNWMCFGDNGKLFYEPKPVWERFPIPTFPYDFGLNGQALSAVNCHIKTAVKCNEACEIYFENPHSCFLSGLEEIVVDDKGIECKNIAKKDIEYTYCYIKHFRTLTISEYLQRRLGRVTYACMDFNLPKENLLNIFFEQNSHSAEKDKIIREAFEGELGKKYKYIPQN